MIRVLLIYAVQRCPSLSSSTWLTRPDSLTNFISIPLPPAARRSAIRRITARSANSVRQEFRVSTTGPARCGRMNTISLITLSGWIHGISATSIGSSGTVILTAKSVNFWILRTGEERISRTPGTQGILTRHTEM